MPAVFHSPQQIFQKSPGSPADRLAPLNGPVPGNGYDAVSIIDLVAVGQNGLSRYPVPASVFANHAAWPKPGFARNHEYIQSDHLPQVKQPPLPLTA